MHIDIVNKIIFMLKEEESSIVIVENTEINSQNDDDQLETSTTQHGHLVQQILNAQKEFSEVNGKKNIVSIYLYLN